MQETLVTCTIADHVALVMLNQPARRNAFSLAMEAQLRAALEAAARDPQVRVIVLSAAGDTFCVGGEVADLQHSGRDLPIAPVGDAGLEANYARRFSYILGLDRPVIAAINGSVAGIGFVLCMYCDLRYMVDDARLSTSFARLGLVAEQGTAWMLPRLIGPMNALDLLLTARAVPAMEAAQMGLVRALPRAGFLERVLAEARSVAAGCSPRSTRIIRRQVYDGLFQSLAQSYQAGEQQERDSFASADHAEGIAAFVHKRPPRFTGG